MRRTLSIIVWGGLLAFVPAADINAHAQGASPSVVPGAAPSGAPPPVLSNGAIDDTNTAIVLSSPNAAPAMTPRDIRPVMSPRDIRPAMSPQGPQTNQPGIGLQDAPALGPQTNGIVIGPQTTTIGPQSNQPAIGQQGSGTLIRPQNGGIGIGQQGTNVISAPRRPLTPTGRTAPPQK